MLIHYVTNDKILSKTSNSALTPQRIKAVERKEKEKSQ